jgi:hypothetical protein
VGVSGNTVVVGAPFDEHAGYNSGAAYVFVRVGDTWVQLQKLVANDAASGDDFGRSVAIAGDTILVGSPWSGAGGAAYVFERNGNTWSQQQKLTASDGDAKDEFGHSVALDGNTAVVGAPSDEPQTNVGGTAGSAYVFVRNGGLWSEQQKLSSFTGDPNNDAFGGSVAVSGETIVVGAIGGDAGPVVNTGSAYVFVRNGGVWSQQQELNASDPQLAVEFGNSVAISGETILVGAQFANYVGIASGSAYVFVRNAGVWSQQQQLISSDAEAFDAFASSVALLGDTALIGAGCDDFLSGQIDSCKGSAYLFLRAGGVWSQHQKITASDAAQGDEFGESVALDTETVVVGAHYKEEPVGDLAGAVYVFGPNTPPVCVAKLTPAECGLTFPSGPTLYAIAVDEEVCLTLDGSDSTDPDGDSLTVSWVVDSGAPATGTTVTECLALGCHTIVMTVSDGFESCQQSLDLCVITAAEAVEQCLALVESTAVERKNKRPLIASLKTAIATLEKGNLSAGYNQLQSFQKKVQVQISQDNPAEAQAFIDCVENILKALACAVALKHGHGVLN